MDYTTMKRTGAALVALFMSSVLVAGCTATGPGTTTGTPTTASTGEPAAGKTVTVWLQQAPTAGSPLAAGTIGDGAFLNVTQDKLAQVAADGTVLPRAATGWKMSDDAKTLTLTLAEQKWSDGEPFSADDVVFTLNLYASPAVKSPVGGSVLKAVAGYDEVTSGAATTLSGVTKVDDRTVTITLASPNMGWMYQFLDATIYLLQEKAVGAEDPATLIESPIWLTPGAVPGLGPFTLTAYESGQRAEFTRNPNFRTPVPFETLIQSLVNQDVATQQLASGEIDLTLVAPTDVLTVEAMASKGIATVESLAPGFDRYSLYQGEGHEYLQNPKVRQGLLTAINRQGIIDSILGGNAEPVNSVFTSPKVNKDGFATYDYDPEKAKQLLTEGGWDFNQELVIVEVNNNALRSSINQVVMQNFQDVGVKVTIRPFDQAQTNDILTTGDYDLLLYGGGGYVADPAQNIPMITCAAAFPTGANLPNYCNPEVDRLLTEAAGVADEAARNALLTQAGELENADVSHLWMARQTYVYAYNTAKITGGIRGADSVSNVLFSIPEWTIG